MQDARFQLARLILTNNDPIATLKRRDAVIDDEKVFNVNLKGTGDKGQYPGPRVNQASSGRCWLFATSEYTIMVICHPDQVSSPDNA